MSDDHPDETVPDGTPSGITPWGTASDADERQEAQAVWAARASDIEAQPLASRAAAFGAVHDELRAVLEGTTDDFGRDGR